MASVTVPVPAGYDAVRRTFGDPFTYVLDSGDVSHAWPSKILALARLPFPLYLSWLPDCAVTKISCHRLIVPVVEQAFADLAAAGFGNDRPLSVGGNDVNEYGGCYAWRAVRGSLRAPSLHCWGIALDLDPVENPLGGEPKIDHQVVDILERRGFTWGGNFGRVDGMHFQYATGC